MPGFHKSRFINIGDKEDELLCGICLGVFDNPMVTPCCKHTYCSDCIREKIKTSQKCPNLKCRKKLSNNKLLQPPIILKNILNKLKVKCDFYEKGCLEEILFANRSQHMNDCRYNQEAICGECGEKNGQISEHNCIELLFSKHKCLQNVRTKINDLESNNKLLIDKNAKLQTELWNLKTKYELKCELRPNLIEKKKRAHGRCVSSVRIKRERLSQSDSMVKSIDTQIMPELTTYEQHINECGNNSEAITALSMPKLTTYKKHANTEVICEDSEECNGECNEHNCFTKLLAQHKCVQTLQNENSNLQNNNKLLTDKIARLDMELLSAKNRYNQIIFSTEISSIMNLIENNNVNNKEIDVECNQLRDELLREKKNHEKTSAELMKEKTHYNRLLETHRHLKKSVNEQKEQLKQKDFQIAKYSPVFDENKRLNEKLLLFEKNILRLSLITQTNLGVKKLQLKVHDINAILKQKIIQGRDDVIIRGLLWHIKVQLFIEDGIKYLSFYLVCNSESDMWSCIASTEMSIQTQNNVKAVHCNAHRFSCVFSNDHNNNGYNKFMPWNAVTDNDYGYVRDNTILLNAYVSVW